MPDSTKSILTLSHGFSYILTCIDHLPIGQKPFIFLISLLKLLLMHLFRDGYSVMVSRSIVTKDGGHKFESELWNQLMKLLG